MTEEGEGKEPFRVLDLACGAGLVRVTVARRLPRREIHYVGIDSRRARLESLERLTRSPAPSEDPPALKTRVRESFHPAELDLHDSDALAAQLEALVGKERFDEIHVHLLHPSKNGRQASAPQVLRTIGTHLRPGGRLYHLFQTSSPFFDFMPERLRLAPRAPSPRSAGRRDAHEWNEERFREGACLAGLRLDKCGHRWEGARQRERPAREDAYENWMTRQLDGDEPDLRTARIYERLAEQYSRFSKYATHFVILRKPAPGEAVRSGTKVSRPA